MTSANTVASIDQMHTDESEPPSLLQVQVANETDATIDVGRLEAAVHAVLGESPYESGFVSIAVVDDATIHELNRQFLEHDYPTDVLSFALEDDPPRLDGEIVVSIDTAERCAAEAGWETADELLLYVVHGALHLAGYGDKSAPDAAEMRAAEMAALTRLGVTPSSRDARWRAEDAEEPR